MVSLYIYINHKHACIILKYNTFYCVGLCNITESSTNTSIRLSVIYRFLRLCSAHGLSADVRLCLALALISPDRSANSQSSRIRLISRAKMTAWWCRSIWWCHCNEMGTEWTWNQKKAAELNTKEECNSWVFRETSYSLNHRIVVCNYKRSMYYLSAEAMFTTAEIEIGLYWQIIWHDRPN